MIVIASPDVVYRGEAISFVFLKKITSLRPLVVASLLVMTILHYFSFSVSIFLFVLIPVICQMGQYFMNPVTTKINPTYAHGVSGPQNASDVISNPSAIRIGRSVAPILVIMINPLYKNIK